MNTLPQCHRHDCVSHLYFEVDELVAAIEATASSRGRTLSEHIRSFRRIIAGAFAIDDPKKYGYRGGGRKAWIDRIDSIQLEKVTSQLGRVSSRGQPFTYDSGEKAYFWDVMLDARWNLYHHARYR